MAEHVERTDVDLILAIAQADQSALAALYDRYASLVLAVCHRMLGERRGAEDLTHDIFLEVWRKAGGYERTRASVRTWLLVRTRSRALDRLRSAYHTRVVIPGDDSIAEQQPADHASDPSLAPDRARVRNAVGALPACQRAVLELAYFDGLSSSEIASRLDVPIGTVKSRTRAALHALRDTLGPAAAAARRTA